MSFPHVLINWCKGHLNLAWWMDWKCSWFDQTTQHVGLWTWWKRKASGTDTISSFGLKRSITPHEIQWIESTGTPLLYISGSRLRCRTCARWCSRFAQEWWQWWVPFWAPKRTTTGSITSGAPSPSRWELPRSGWISRVGKPQAQRRVFFLESVWNMLYFVLAKRRFKDVKWYDVTSTLNLGELMRMTDIVLLDLNRSTTFNGRCHLATRPGILMTPAFCCFVDFLVGIGQWLLAILGNLESQ